MTKQKTVIDQLLTMLEFRADSQALDRVIPNPPKDGLGDSP